MTDRDPHRCIEALETTDDAFLGGAIDILQPRKGHRAGLDAVFLAAAVPGPDGKQDDAPLNVLEAGSGSGVVSLAIARRLPTAVVTGIEVEAPLVVLARQNAQRNGLADRATFIEGDVTQPRSTLEPRGLVPNSFERVVANPPFYTHGRARASPMALRERASHMRAGGLDDWARFLAAMAAPGATMTLVHRADALAEILAALEGRFGALVVFPLFPKKHAPARRVLVQGRRASRAPLRLARGMVLHDDEGAQTPEAAAILRGTTALDLAS